MGSSLKLLDENKNEVSNGVTGEFCFKNTWTMSGRTNKWIATGDLGYSNAKGYYFLCGRTDDRIVSGGENVYPVELEQVLLTHPFIVDAVVIGIDDETFGQRLKAFVVPEKNAPLTEEALIQWLRLKVARYQMPKEVQFLDHIPYTEVGKVDKMKLRQVETHA